MKIKDIVKINELTINSKYPHNYIQYFDTSSVIEGKFQQPQYLKLKEAPSRAKRIIRHNDILISTVRPNLKHFGIIKNPPENAIGSTGFAVITCKKVIPDYLYRVLTTDWYTDFLSSIAESQQSNYPAFNPSLIENTEINLPPLLIQRKIASVLTAYDDLIENNNRRIAILEKMAEEIYREWFVRLRFPEHEKTKIVKGVPDGWEVKRIGVLVTTQYGYTASADMFADGPKFLRITDIVPSSINWETVPHCEINENNEKNYLLNDGDIVVARTGATAGYAKRINKKHPKSIFASYLVRLIPKDHRYAIYLGLSVERASFKDFINMYVTGAAQPQANATTMSLFPVYVPPADIVIQFNDKIEPILDLKEQLSLCSTRLNKSRDRLLSRLMSGKIDLENLEILEPKSINNNIKDCENAHSIENRFV